MTWDYYDIKKIEIKKEDTYGMSMTVKVEMERDGEFILPEEIYGERYERELHSMVQDVLQELVGKAFYSTVEDEEGEVTITAEVESVSENR
jgi:hypothetical protein